MTTELVVSPSGHRERASLAEAPAWRAYAADLRDFLGLVAVLSGVGQLEVTELLVAHPLPDRYGELRNGVQVDLAAATDLAERMAAGVGPYCRLTAPGKLRIESGWDGAIHLLVNPAVADALTGLGGGNLSVERRTSAPEPEEESFVGDVADEEFWNGCGPPSAGWCSCGSAGRTGLWLPLVQGDAGERGPSGPDRTASPTPVGQSLPARPR
ncbi:hypothetical protein [Streptomyces albidoflavus]|uniref:hypothetical protein n=1 Tax=Streptomyces albidoflavus TaxID=1886 RepID=UPI0033B5206E